MSAQPHFSQSAPSLSAWIAAARRSLGLTQQEFAAAVGSHWVSVSKWERGQMHPNKKVIAKIEALLQERAGPTAELREAAPSYAQWDRGLRDAIGGDQRLSSEQPLIADEVADGLRETSENYELARTTVQDAVREAQDAAATSRLLDAIRDDLGEALGLLQALITLVPGQPTDIANPAQCVARASLERVRRAFERVTDAWEQQP